MNITQSKYRLVAIAVCSVAAAISIGANAAGLSTEELSAEEVMQRFDQRYDGETVIADYTLVLIDRRERQRSRNLRIYSKEYGDDKKTLSLFQTPADIRGTAYLNFDWDDTELDDDSWLYLPSIQRVKRLASSNKSDSFLGSDFTYADINGFEIEWYDYNFVNESELVDGQECWVIEAIPKPQYKSRAEDETGYSKLQMWIRKDNFVQQRAQVWELRGNRIKFFNASEIEQIDGIWTSKRLQVRTTKNGRLQHSSVLQLNDVQYNVDIDDGLLTTESMQRGLN